MQQRLCRVLPEKDLFAKRTWRQGHQVQPTRFNRRRLGMATGATAHHRRRIPRALRVAHRRSVSGQLFEPARRSRRIPPHGRCPAMAIGDPGLLRTGLVMVYEKRRYKAQEILLVIRLNKIVYHEIGNDIILFVHFFHQVNLVLCPLSTTVVFARWFFV
jgi:hypothetical protein